MTDTISNDEHNPPLILFDKYKRYKGAASRITHMNFKMFYLTLC